MRAYAEIRAERDRDGATRLPVLRSQAPLVLRQTLGGVRLVAGAGGPLGGDDLALAMSVGAGAALSVGSAAATLVQPGAAGARPWACLAVSADVAAGGSLQWSPEPAVVAAGAALHTESRLTVAPEAWLRWREVLVLGRMDEAAGDVVAGLSLDVGGHPVLRQTTRLGPGAPPGWDGAAVTAGRRVLGSLLLAGPEWAPAPAAYGRRGAAAYAVLPLAVPHPGAGAVLVTALGDTTTAVTAALDAGLDACGVPSPRPPDT